MNSCEKGHAEIVFKGMPADCPLCEAIYLLGRCKDDREKAVADLDEEILELKEKLNQLIIEKAGA